LPEIRNPNLEPQGPGGGGGGGGDFRSLMIFTFLALFALMAFQYFRPSQQSSKSDTQTQQAQQAQQTQTSSQPTAASSGSATVQASSATPAISAAAETETVIENELYRITFTNRGAQVKHWILKKYKDSAGKPLDIVQPQTSARFGYPLSFFTYDSGLTGQLNQALYQASATGQALAPTSLTFHYSQNGIDAVKTFSFDSSYVISINTTVTHNGAPVRALVSWPAGLGDMEEFLPSSATRSPVRTSSQFAWSLEGKQDTTAAPKVSGNATLDQPYDWAGISDLYFAAAFLPNDPSRASVVTLHNTIDLPSDLTDPGSAKKPADVIGVAMGDQSGSSQMRLYAGPKEMDVLNSVRAMGADGKPNGPSLAPLIQYGWWTVIAKPLYFALRWLRNLMGPGAYNWGWAIIIVTVIFNLIMLPTRLMMMKSSLKMMRIQPKVEALKKRYAHLKLNDPKRSEMNTEMMALYKEEGVNMYGGCLPLLLQMPLFFAYYRVLLNAVELRQAQWFWLRDLSMPDSLHILPILIIATMFLVQFITPSPGMDPTQRRMMAIMMPAIMGFTLWHFASGLALYWVTGNIINLIIQIAINQSKIGKEMHAIAARRAEKKSGGKGSISPRVIQGRR
jgi:YidC/Oxa1 family membrane protein insertase